ncbi:hypothetical protein JXI42_05980 [bacterium]|nr:hypothetical protein [bacterium]
MVNIKYIRKFTLCIMFLLMGFVSNAYTAYSAPTGLTVQAGDPACIDLSWNAHWFEDYENPSQGWYVRYNVERGNNSTGYTEENDYTDCGLEPEDDYCYQVRAELYYYWHWYYSKWTKKKCDVPGTVITPSVPVNFAVETGDSATINLSWEDTSSFTEWFEIQRDGHTSEGDYMSTVYEDYPLESGSYHCYKVRACIESGCSDFTQELCDTAGNPLFSLPEIGEMPCKYPPFLSSTVPANVCIIFDNSGSMNYQAYYGNYNPAREYYGYADPQKYYEYQSNVYEPITYWSGTADPYNNRFSGNFLNWVTMRRVDIARKVMVGGKCLSRVGSGPKVLVGEKTDDKPARAFHKYYNEEDYYIYGDDIYYEGDHLSQIKIRTTETVEGVVQSVSERLDLGLMFFNYDQGGYVADFIGNPGVNIITHIENETPSTWTPLAETYYEATRYFGAQQGYFTNRNYAAHDPIIYGCEKNFVILITDGESTQDQDVPGELKEYDNYTPDPVPDEWDQNGSEDLRDVALWAHVNDLRPDWQDYDCYLFLYTIYAFGEEEDKATTLLKRAARNGGFDDMNGNKIPDLNVEWDKNGDGDPDSYFYGKDGTQLEGAINSAMTDILTRLDVSSQASVVTNSIKGEGNAFQTVFSPKKLFGQTALDWTGNVQALWVDQMGNLREDTDEDDHLDMIDDYIVNIIFNGDNTIGERYQDIDGDGSVDNYIDMLPVDRIKFVWNAGNELHTRSASSRVIQAVIPDSYGEGFTTIDFTTANSDDLKDFLNTSQAGADSIINYTRGVDYSKFRSRTVNGNVWKLADIINSRPVYVAEPRERFDLLYNDVGYMNYYLDKHDRQGVLYIGGNDGILKAFNAGRYKETGDPVSPGWLDGAGEALGKEIWGLVPYNLLPHLEWLTSPYYCHVYYIDLKMKAIDAKIFTPDDTHTDGWGTVLICGQNFGGTPCPVITGDILSSSFLVLDVTDPDDFEVLWVFNDDDLGYTTTYPTIAKVDSTWLLIFGSGPTGLDGISEQKAYVYVADLKSGEVLFKHKFTEENSCLSDPVSVDVDMDFNTDIAYFGLNVYDLQDEEWYGKMYRLNFYESENPGDWEVSKLIDIQRPVQAAGAVTMDQYGNIWVLFGTGRYTSNADERSTKSQYFAGLKDPYWATGAGSVSFSSLYDVSDCDVYETDTGYVVKNTPGGEVMYNEFLQNVNAAAGWYSEFPAGERVTTEPTLIGEQIFFTTFQPNMNICEFGGTAKLFGVYYMTGTAEPFTQALGKREVVGGMELIESVVLGEGVPTSPTAHIGMSDQATISVQMSTGEIHQEKANISGQKSAAIFWKGR